MIEDKIKRIAFRTIKPPIVRYSQVARLAGVLYLIGAVVPFLIPGINFAVFNPKFADNTISAGTPITLDVFGTFAVGELFGPLATFGSAESTYAGLWGFIVDGFIAPTFFIIGFPAGIIITVLPIAFGIMLWNVWDKYLRLVGFSYGILFSVYTIALSANSIVLQPGLGALCTLAATFLTIFIGMDRAKWWGLIAFNYHGAKRDRDGGEFEREGEMTPREAHEYLD